MESNFRVQVMSLRYGLGGFCIYLSPFKESRSCLALRVQIKSLVKLACVRG